jgi:acetoin utilization protein AcuB
VSGQKLEIQTVMHPLPHTVTPRNDLKQALHMMQEHNIRHLPVQDGGDLVGILSQRDIDFALRYERRLPDEMLVREAYTPDPYTVKGTDPVAVVAAKMAHEHIGCALVVRDRALIGIFTTVDACRALSEVLSGRMEQ